MMDTQKQYLLGIMNAIIRKYPGLEILKPWNVHWYTDLYGALKMCGTVEAIHRGDSIGERTEGIHQELLIDIAEALLKRKKLKSNNSVTASTRRRELDPSTQPTKWVRLILHLRDADLFREAEQGSMSA